MNSVSTTKRISATHDGFTLLELMLVVGMIAMLVSFIGFNMFSGIAKGRDTRRLQDVNDFQKALQLAYITDKHYPIYTTEIVINGTDALNTLMMSRGDQMGIIKDPINDSTYQYWYKSNGPGTTYEIRFCQETKQERKWSIGCANIMTP
jgi:prepilin-type N-terminal cleavage/methylation domain-containing protein